ncbi:MAG: hypothetical protein PF572_02625 [Patescibacteria group bacterium]|jgi:hypothetical protein|nr:hypothetical protein [Patescibacteria group bacterium]
MKNLNLISFLFAIFLVPLFSLQASYLRPPVLSDINPGLKNFSEPFVSGFTEDFSNVLVYIDGNYSGDANIVKGNKQNNFYFFINNLPSEGSHSLFLIARDLNGIMSAPTEEFNFLITHNLDTPQVVKTNINSRENIVCQSDNENFVDVIVDGVKYSTMFIERNSNANLNFDYSVLPPGDHLIAFTARDAVGRTSKTTESLKVKSIASTEPVKEDKNNNEGYVPINNNLIPATNVPSISSEGASEGVIVEGVDNMGELPQIIPVLGNDEKNDEEKAIDDILNKIDKENKEQIGSLDESGEKQSDLKVNLFIFLGFLVAVVLWIIWVNREVNEEEKNIESDEEEKN